MASKYYRFDQEPPVLHWYQKKVGWFGKTLVLTLILGLTGSGVFGYAYHINDQKSLAALVNKSRLQKVTASPIEETPAKNIIDVQTVLDRWVKDHPNQKFSVVAKSIEGPTFDAKLNQDKTYESLSLHKLFLLVPLYAQVPHEQHKTINLAVNGGQKSMSVCVDVMIRLSNDICNGAVSSYIDWDKTSDLLKQHGLNKTSFFDDNKNLKTTAQDTADLLQKINSDLFSTSAKSSVLSLLREQYYRQGVPASCPGCVVANKADGRDSLANDAAIVQYSGGRYVLVIIAKDSSLAEISELSGRIQQKILDTTNY